MAQVHPTAAAMPSYRRTRATAARKSHHKATAMAQGHPTAAAMASYTRSRLPFARPQTLQKPSRPSKSPASSARKRYPNKPNTRHSRTQKPPQGHSNGSRAPHGRSNGFFYRRSSLPFARPQTLHTLQNPPNPPKVRPAPQGKGTPTSPTCATLARKSHQKATAMAQEHPTAAAMASFIGVQGCRLPGLKPSIPSKTLQTLQKSGQLRREKVPQQAQHAPLPHAKATTRPQQWLKGTPRPQQWLLIRVQGCRLPGLKPSKTLQTLQTLQKSGQLRREQVPQQAQHAPLSHAKATTRPQQWLKSTPRPQQWLLLYAFKAAVCQASNSPYRPKPSKPSKSPASSAGKRYPNKPNTRHSRTQKPPQGHSNGSRAPHGRSNGFL